MGRPSSAKAPKSAAPDDPFSPTLRAWFRDNGIFWTGLRFERAEGRGVFGVALYHFVAEDRAVGPFTTYDLASAATPKR